MYQTANNREFDALMKRTHELYVEVTLTNGNGDDIANLSDRLIDGNVIVDQDAPVTRACELVLFDPARRVHLDPGSPQRTSVFIDQRVEVVYTIIDPENGDQYSCPLFAGGIDDVSRDDVYISIKALGMEAFAVNNSFRAKTYKKKQPKTRVIKHLIKNHVGAEGMRIPDLKKVLLPQDIKLNRNRAAWPLAVRIADTMGRRLIMDARGWAVWLRRSRKSRFTFDTDWVVEKPDIEYDLSQVINTVLVIGRKPNRRGNRGREDRADKKKRPKYKAVAPKKHPLSPKKLGRNGVPRYLWVIIEDDSLRSVKECRARAKRELQRGLDAGVAVQFTGIPQPRLQEGDMATISVPGYHGKFPMRRFTIPLKAGVNASYGTVFKTKPKAKKKAGK